jgi:peptidoglycan/xylan/chitin deacetylase (PgdA/CDA1 family)
MYIISLSFDDGFERSNRKIAEIYEKFGLSACFNVLALRQLPDREQADPYDDNYPVGNFDLWNRLQSRGHEIMPHGLLHNNLTEMPLEEAQRSVIRCLEVFENELDGFDPDEAIFNFTFNASTPEIEAWLPSVVKAYRTGGEALNPLPYRGQTKLTTTGFGPKNCEDHLDQQIENLFLQPEGWLIYNTHGLDDEGWGPIRASYLEVMLAKLTKIDGLMILPVGRALALPEEK